MAHAFRGCWGGSIEGPPGDKATYRQKNIGSGEGASGTRGTGRGGGSVQALHFSSLSVDGRNAGNDLIFFKDLCIHIIYMFIKEDPISPLC